MLERTAGCLESGSLRRLIPGSKTVTNRRMLHSGFWSHGTAELEMSPLWQALVQVSEARETAVMDAARNGGALGGGAFLDFLYPTGALSLLRQCTPWAGNGMNRRKTRTAHPGLGQRSYSATTGDSKPKNEGVVQTREKMLDNLDDIDEVDRELGLYAEQGPEVLPRIEMETPKEGDIRKPLLNIIRDGRSNDYEEAWRQFRLLPREPQLSVASELIDYFSTSDRQIDARRIIQLFEDIKSSAQEYQFRILITAHVILGNFEGAMEEHTMASNRFDKLMEGDRILGSLISNSQWDLAYELWSQDRTFLREHPKSGQHEYQLWKYVTELENITERALKITGYFASVVDDGDAALKVFLGRILYSALFPRQGVDRKHFVQLFKAWRSLNLDNDHFQEYSARAVAKLVRTDGCHKLAVNLYKSVRETEGLRFSQTLLQKLLDICCKTEDVAGQDMVLADWATLFGKVPSKALWRCIKSSASSGDANRVHELFKMIAERGVNRQEGIRNPDDFNPLLLVHARRGEVEQCEEVFHQMYDVYGMRQNLVNKNILLSAYGKANYLDEAYKLYSKMIAEMDKEKKPHDDYTVGTMMGIFTQQGDSASAKEVYNAAMASGTKKTSAIIDCLVQCHIQVGEMQEAEELCKSAARRILDAPSTRMWNYLLVAYAMRRDTQNVSRIHRLMDANNVPFDSHTYSAILLALAVGGQPAKAFSIMTDVMPEAGVEITRFHYAVVMGGFIRTKEYEKVISLHKRMLEDSRVRARGTASSARIQAMKAAASLDQKFLLEGSTDDQFMMAEEYFFQALTGSDASEIASTSRKGIAGSEALDIADIYSKFDFYIFIAGQNRAFNKARELTQHFLSLLPAQRKNAIPLKLYSSLMLAQYNEGNFQGVEDTWNLAFEVAKYQARDRKRNSGIVLYTRRFDLARLINTVIQSYRDQNKMQQLRTVIRQLIEAGFVLDSKNYNLYIQALTRTHFYKEAFELCETKLMPGWTGWSKVRGKELVRNRLDVVTRRLKENPEHLRPVFHTLLFLTKAYLEMEAASGLDKGFGFRLKQLEETCPKTLHAIRTMQREGDDLERVVLSDNY